MLSAAGLTLAACDRREPSPPAQKVDAAPAAAPAPADPLLEAVNGVWRTPEERRRDRFRHPVETLRFFGLKPGATVVEFWPGAGWWTQILAPYLARTGGTYYAAQADAEPALLEAFRQRFANAALYGSIKLTRFGPSAARVAPEGSADLVLFMRNLHNWMAAGLAEKAFRDARAAMKPGGVLGIEQHRADPAGLQDPIAATGYVQEAYVRQLAEEAGFRFDGASEVNANARDDRDHPFGVWTLPPIRRSSPRGEPEDPTFDHMPYDAVGESDRMTLRFRKP
jgi:predicted methyltransferase